MAARLQFDPWFEGEGEGAVAPAAAPVRLSPPRELVAARFDFPWLGQPVQTEAAETDVAPPARTFCEAELAAALAAARAEAATEAKVRAELSARQLALDQASAARASASLDVALALARALVPRALERQPLADVEAMLRDLLIRLEGQQRLTLALPPSLVEAGRQRALELAAAAGYRGELVIEADAQFGRGDARLSWPGGSAECDLAAFEREVFAIVDAWLPDPAAASPDPVPMVPSHE